MSRRLGAIVQGLVLGGLLTWALLNVIAATTRAAIFHYQGF